MSTEYRELSYVIISKVNWGQVICLLNRGSESLLLEVLK